MVSLWISFKNIAFIYYLKIVVFNVLRIRLLLQGDKYS